MSMLIEYTIVEYDYLGHNQWTEIISKKRSRY